MQTFMPYPSFEASLRCLDYRRLGKQRVEAKQILNALTGNSAGWRNHPATLMWEGHVDALKAYYNQSVLLWVERGYNNTLPLQVIPTSVNLVLPPWFGLERFHSSHRSALLFKDLEWYSQFRWTESPEYNYYWPSEHDGL